jgi:sulfite exporter TauE/SafE
MLADCLHDLTALGTDALPAMLLGLFLAGLASGATHCSAMCAPFVLAQASAGQGAGGGVLRRLSGAALAPYHLGRVLGYGMLGALAGGTAGALARVSGLDLLLGLLLAGGAVLMLGQALRQGVPYLPTSLAAPRLRARLAATAGHLGLPRAAVPRFVARAAVPRFVARPLAALLAAPQGWRGVALGLLLSALPCGVLYGALAAAAASGSMLAGALAMAAFALGTAPALVGLAAAGRFFGRRHGRAMGAVGAGLFALNGVLLMGMATRFLLA